MSESRILSNIEYGIKNYSNYDIVTEETRDIVDVPYFPAQNLVDVSKELNVHTISVDNFIPFVDKFDVQRIFGIKNRTDARFLFIEMADDARYLHYAFIGNSFPQGRASYTITYDGANVYIFAGYANGRCLNDLWEYNVDSNSWANLNYTITELGANASPTRRRKSALLKKNNEIWIYGGETDTLTINSDTDYIIVPLNDIWHFDMVSKSWTNFDKNRVLPHREGTIVYTDNAYIKIAIDSGTNEIGQFEQAGIWTIDRATDEVTFNAQEFPFSQGHTNKHLYIDGAINILTGTSLYRWDNTAGEFVLEKSGITCINPEDKQYWVVSSEEVNHGGHAGMESVSVHKAVLHDYDGTELDEKTTSLPPKGIYIPRINIDNVQTFFYGGMIDTSTFNESTFIMNHTTLDVQKYDFDETEKPTERVFPALSYDKYRGRVYLYGGFDGTKYYNDLWYFDLGLKTWHLVVDHSDEEGNFPAPRQRAGMCVVADDFLYIIGGYSDVRSFSEFWKYNIVLDTWDKVYLVDDIPWGSQYYIFEWRDRLWMYNGQQLYRYFYAAKQFIAQPFLLDDEDTSDEKDPYNLRDLITQLRFLETPIQVSVVNDAMFVQNANFMFKTDMETRIVTDLKKEFGIGKTENLLWLDNYLAVGDGSNSMYFINVSPMYPLTKNQIPHSFFHKDIQDAIPDAVFFTDYTAANGTAKMSYQDNSGVFKIQGNTIPLNKALLLVDEKISFTAPQSKYPAFDFDDTDNVWNETIGIAAQPTTYPYSPWFLYSKFTPIGQDKYKGAQTVVYNDNTERLYIIYKNGNTMKINPNDNTFFVYFTKLWEGAAIGYHNLNNKIYAFGGVRNERATYAQSGMECVALTHATENNVKTETSHCGLMEFDLNINEMNLGSMESYLRDRDVTSVDYSISKEYLTDLITKYIEGYTQGVIADSLDNVKAKIYTATQPIIDDLSQFDYAFEEGDRPTGRTFTANCQIGNKLYMFGGAQTAQDSCKTVQSPAPGHYYQPGYMQNLKGMTYNLSEESRKSFIFDMDSKTWTELAMLPKWLYLSGCIISPDERFIYIVGGFSGGDCTSLSPDIYIYDTQTNSYETMQGIPKNFAARAMPILKWLDEDRLLIMYGFYTLNIAGESQPPCSNSAFYHMPIQDAWIYDKRKDIMYQTFEDLHGFMGIVAKDTFYISEEHKENRLYILAPSPEYNSRNDVVMKVFEWNLVNGEVDPIEILPTTEIQQDWSGFDLINDEDKIKDTGASVDPEDMDYQKIFLSTFENSNFRFRYCWMQQYGAYDHKHMFIIGERGEESGISMMEEIARGHAEAHLRIWYVDLEAPDQSRYLHNVPYEYPLSIAPVAIAYDGSQYLYCIYNKYNIWRLDFAKMLEDNNGSWWYRLPPCIDCNFLGDSRTDAIWDTFFMEPQYLALVSLDGRMARMDKDTFTWFVDKAEPPAPPVGDEMLMSASGIDDNEMYMYKLGSISGKVMNVYEKQWDNFFFDMRQTSKVVENFGDIIESKMWPTVVKRRRLYTVNHLGHIFYAWLRIDGEYDVEFQLYDFYKGNEIRIYGDYEFLNNWSNTVVSIYDIESGWSTLDSAHYTAITNEVGWDWDGEFTRQYTRTIIDSHGNYTTQYSKQPPNYLKVDVAAALGTEKPMSKIRVYYKNTTKPYNYLSRINKVELISNQETVAIYDDPEAVNPLQIVHIEPIKVQDVYSNAFAVYIKNTGDNTVKDVIVYAYDNDWIQFTLDDNVPDSWVIRDQGTPFPIIDEIVPGGDALFYVRGINIDERPHTKDLVLKGIYPYEG